MSNKYYSPLHPNPGVQVEMDFICKVLANELFPDRELTEPPKNLNWSILAKLLELHRLTSLFHTILSNRKESFPKPFLLRLRKARYELLIYGDGCLPQVTDILSSLVDSNISVIVLKGWALIPTFYEGDYAQRYCEDIDILIRPQDLDQVETILKSLKYGGFPEVHPGYSRRFTNARAYLRADSESNHLWTFSIGLHWGLTHYPFFDKDRVQINDLFDRARRLEIEGINILQLSAEDDLIYSCAHLSLHHRNQETFLQYYEIAIKLLLNLDTLNWVQIFERASLWGYSVQLKKILVDLERLWPGILPDAVVRSLADFVSPRKEEFLDLMVAHTKGKVFRSSLIQFLFMPSWRDKIVSLVQQLFPSRKYMQIRYRSLDYPLSILYIYRFIDSVISVIKD